MVLPHLIFKRRNRLALWMLYIHQLRESKSFPINVGIVQVIHGECGWSRYMGNLAWKTAHPISLLSLIS